MKKFIVFIVAIAFYSTTFAQVEILTNGNVVVGNSSVTNEELNVGGDISASRLIDKDDSDYWVKPYGLSNMLLINTNRKH